MHEDKYKLIIKSLGEERVKIQEKLAYHTFTKKGGPADCFFIATSQKELIQALDIAHQLKVPFFIIGGGSKILISDEGIKAFVIKNRSGNIKINGIKGKVGKFGLGVDEALIEVDSGVSLSKLNDFLKVQNLKEIDTFSTKNSTIGSIIFLDNNIQNMSSNIRVWEDGEVLEVDSIDLKRNKHIVISAVLKIKSKF